MLTSHFTTRFERMRRNELGFTLIELLVVIIIIGILAAVAIPLFLDQRKLAVDASVKSDVRNTATAVQTWLASNQNAVATDATDFASKGGKVSQTTGDTVNLSVATDGSYLVCGYAGTAAKAYTAATTAYVFDSTSGKFGLGSCTGGIVGGGSPSSSTPAAPAASFTTSVNGLSVSLDGTASTNVAGTTPYTWSYGDGTANQSTATATNSHTYTTGGTYTVTLTVKNADGGATNSTTRSVTVASPPVVTYNGEDGTTNGFGPGASHSISLVSSPVHSGTKAIAISGNSSYAGMASLTVPSSGLQTNTNYTITGWVYIATGGGLYLARDSNGGNPTNTVNTTGSWQQITTTVNTGSSTGLPYMSFFRPAYTTMNVYFDDFTITKS